MRTLKVYKCINQFLSFWLFSFGSLKGPWTTWTCKTNHSVKTRTPRHGGLTCWYCRYEKGQHWFNHIIIFMIEEKSSLPILSAKFDFPVAHQNVSFLATACAYQLWNWLTGHTYHFRQHESYALNIWPWLLIVIFNTVQSKTKPIALLIEGIKSPTRNTMFAVTCEARDKGFLATTILFSLEVLKHTVGKACIIEML